jgi:predicted anti-sigma-YlaC factor YlaD
MHRVIQDRLEEVLADSNLTSPAAAHLTECGECRDEVSAMRQHASMLRALRAPQADDPRPGFYARVMERIEAQRPVSIWQLFDSAFGRRIAIASMALAVFFSVYLVSSERLAEQPQPASVRIAQAGLPDNDTVLVSLVTYREQ